VVREADAVAQDGALGERARRVDRDDADPLVFLRYSLISSAMMLLFPTPGGPVKPTVTASPVSP
jgi:hypothetical protein